MAVFFDTGGGDIYAGPTREAVIEAMKADCDDVVEAAIEERSGSMKMRVPVDEDESEYELSTLEEEYDEALGSYCIASENC